MKILVESDITFMFRGEKLLMYCSTLQVKPPGLFGNEGVLKDTLQHLKRKSYVLEE